MSNNDSGQTGGRESSGATIHESDFAFTLNYKFEAQRVSGTGIIDYTGNRDTVANFFATVANDDSTNYTFMY